MAGKVLNPKMVIVTLAGIPIQGWADGTFLSIDPVSESYNSQAGADGEVLRVQSNDRRFRITLTLLQSSDSNILLSDLHNLDINSPNGAGVGIFSVADLNGTTLFTGPETWIVGFPAQPFAKTPQNREWVLECAEGQAQVGGN